MSRNLRLCASSVVVLCLLAVTPVSAVPTAKLPLTCSNPGDIGKTQNNCSGLWLYQLPNTEELIVLRGPSSNPVWTRASGLSSIDTVAICALPVEPGSYSGCKDQWGIRRVVYVPKSEIFIAPSAPPPVPGAYLLDLQRVPVEINQAGLYLLDRNWNPPTSPMDGTIVITADNVTLDLQGFALSTGELAIRSTGQNVAIRNGRVNAEFGGAIRASGAGTRIERIRAQLSRGAAVELSGEGSILTDSVVSTSEGTVVAAGDDTTVRGNTLQGRNVVIRVASRTTIFDNALNCGVFDPCITVDGTENLLSRNRVNSVYSAPADGLLLRGSHNQVMDNVFYGRCIQGSPSLSRAAIIVEGRGNTVRDNLVPGLSCGTVWQLGIVFTQDGNSYGGNHVWANMPFDLGATVQTDLGGNVGN